MHGRSTSRGTRRRPPRSRSGCVSARRSCPSASSRRRSDPHEGPEGAGNVLTRRSMDLIEMPNLPTQDFVLATGGGTETPPKAGRLSPARPPCTKHLCSVLRRKIRVLTGAPSGLLFFPQRAEGGLGSRALFCRTWTRLPLERICYCYWRDWSPTRSGRPRARRRAAEREREAAPCCARPSFF